MIIETKRKHRVYKDPIIIYEYKTNRQMGIIERLPFMYLSVQSHS